MTGGSGGLATRLERYQVPIYVGGILVGLVAPSAGSGLETAINPILGVLLYVTFLQVPAVNWCGHCVRAGSWPPR